MISAVNNNMSVILRFILFDHSRYIPRQAERRHPFCDFGLSRHALVRADQTAQIAFGNFNYHIVGVKAVE